MCNSRAGTAPPPGGQAGTPRPRVQLEVGPGEGSPGKARGWGTGREPPQVPAAWPTGAGEQLSGSRVGRPLPVPHNVDPGTWLHSRGSPHPSLAASRSPACPWTLLLFCPHGGRGAWKAAPGRCAQVQPEGSLHAGEQPTGHMHCSLAENSGRPHGHPAGFPPPHGRGLGTEVGPEARAAGTNR